MSSREAYIDKMSKKLKAWDSKIDDLQNRAVHTGGEVKTQYETKINNLKSKTVEIRNKLNEYANASSEALKDIKNGIKKAQSEFKKELKS